jgi:hypothetical protein
VIVSVAVLVIPSATPEMTTGVVALTLEVVTWKVALVAP